MIALAVPASAQEDVIKTSGSAIDVATRPGVTVRYLLFKPAAERPRAGVILFIGGQGALPMPDKVGSTWQSSGNFLPRSREHFLRRGVLVAVVNTPSDFSGGYGTFRNSAEHAEDISAVIADVRRRARRAPVWLIGTSRGTVSVVNVAARLQDARGPDGVVLTSAVTRPDLTQNAPPGDKQTVYDAGVGAIRVPALVVYHRNDNCYLTPSIDAPALLAKLTAAPRKEGLIFDGGGRRGDDCGALSAHGFLDIERLVVDAIVDWILATAKPEKTGS